MDMHHLGGGPRAVQRHRAGTSSREAALLSDAREGEYGGHARRRGRQLINEFAPN